MLTNQLLMYYLIINNYLINSLVAHFIESYTRVCVCVHSYLQTSLPFENVEDLMTSGAIQA